MAPSTSDVDKRRKNKNFRQTEIKRLEELLETAKLAESDANYHTIFKFRYEKIESIRDDFLKYHNIIIGLLPMDEEETPDDSYVFEDNIRNKFENMYFLIKSIEFKLFPRDAGNVQQSQNPNNNNSTNVTLPKIVLPQFCGDITAFSCYIDMYDALIHTNSSLSDIEKFNYLLASLKGAALALVQHLPMTSANYNIAYDTLVKRYKNQRLIAAAHWGAIENTPKLNNDDAVALRQMLDIFNDNLAALKNLALPIDHWDFILVQMILKRLDVSLATRFELHHDSTNFPSYKDLAEFLSKHCNAIENINLSRRVKTKKIENNKPNSAIRTSSFMVQTKFDKCCLCKQDHTLYRCSDFLSKSPNERYQIVKHNKCCVNCLSNSHTLKQCKSTVKCYKCDRLHHTLLHFEKTNNSLSEPVAATSSAAVSDKDSVHTSNQSNTNTYPSVQTAFLSYTSSVLLSTAQVEVLDKFGNYIPMRCLLDSGSMTSFITQRSVNRLGLRGSGSAIHLNGLGDMQTLAKDGGITISIRPCKRSKPHLLVDAVILNRICEPLPTSPIPRKKWSHTAKLRLADPFFDRPGEIDILLGAEVFTRILLDGRILGEHGEPDAVNTIFGYVLMGKVNNSVTDSSLSSFFCTVEESTPLEITLKKFFEVEHVPEVHVLSPEDMSCEKMFMDTHSRDPSGRYIVSLPFRDIDPIFPGIRSLAVQRFYSLERRLLKNPSVYNQYSDFMKEYLSLGHMELVSETSIPPATYYIPHHCVMKPDSTTTKLRVVFNASARLPNGSSLNDHLMIGPKLQRDIFAILLNFRRHPFVVTADIKMMYRQILVVKEHQEFQRIVWRFNPTDPLEDYRLRTITYGINSSPYLAIRTLLKLAEDEGDHFPLAADALRESTYMDDICTGSSTLEGALELQKELIEILRRGGFQLRKWSSNHPSLLSHLPESDLSINPRTFDSDIESSLKVLGLQWNPSSDTFKFSVKSVDDHCTKRILLSNLARIFDPLGVLSPVTFMIKHLIQRLWCLKLDWDEPPPQDISHIWKTFTSEIMNLTTINLPRQLFRNYYEACDLNCFVDASEKGYCAIIYFVFISRKAITSHFVCAKSKVAPLKKISLPKLELSAAVLGAKLVSYVTHIFSTKITFRKITCWSDSSITLCWIRASAHRWQTFISNRVAFIHEKVPSSCWFHVPSDENPADVGSRGVLPSQLSSNSLWWEGPPFLKKIDAPCLSNEDFFEPPEALLEEKKFVFVNTADKNFLDELLERHSCLYSLTRTLVLILRFINNCRKPNEKLTGNMVFSEMHSAQLVLVKHTQSLFFHDEISMIEKGKGQKWLKKLSPFIDEKGILRVGGRLHYAPVSYDKRFPALLPSRCHLTELIITNFHINNLHAGNQTVHSLISRQFWILSPRRSIRRVLSKCIRCWRTNPTSTQPRMGNLPAVRVTPSKPFLHVGVDYAGPFRITMSKVRGAKPLKAYLCLFVCLVTKALHLEVASDLSADAFLAALRRFVARRGRCQSLYSDCGTNFLAAQKQINQIMESLAIKEGISFSQIPPSSPWFGGLWESGVKSVKTHFLRVIGEQTLTYEELTTVFAQIEAVLNSRPLTPISNDPNDLRALTPGHFLTMEPLVAVPEVDMQLIPANRLSRWQLIQRIHQSFWSRWSNEYLHTLHQRSKWHDNSVPINPGTLVLLKTDNVAPLHWPLGRVVQVFPGADGTVRVASIKTINGVVRRPVAKLCPLPNDE